MHFWSGYYCLTGQEKISGFSPVVSISDVITVVSDFGNKIPDKSWMLYLLELFNSQHIPVELNLICSFNDEGKFHAIFGGTNKYEFKIKPIVGHSYLRQIILEQSKQRIAFHLKDQNTGESDSFFLNVENAFNFSISKHFTGLEWHNRIENMPYPIRYEAEISNLAYGICDDMEDIGSIAYYPYDKIMPETEGIGKEHPVSFHNFEVKNGFISYKISSGKHNAGIANKFIRPYL